MLGKLEACKGARTNGLIAMALKVRPAGERSIIRLHAQKAPDQPLVGYELYEKELKSTSMEFVGRTDWNGEIRIEKGVRPMRLLYVKKTGVRSWLGYRSCPACKNVRQQT